MRTVKLTHEGLGVLRALARLGVMRRYDHVGLALAKEGLATVDRGRLVITAAGRAAAGVVAIPRKGPSGAPGPSAS
jgi:hypothetical protein